jgi:hypothetical protein
LLYHDSDLTIVVYGVVFKSEFKKPVKFKVKAYAQKIKIILLIEDFGLKSRKAI